MPEIRIILCETLHRMSIAPVELRRKFVHRDVLVILLKLLEVYDQFEVQFRAFEASYFLTLACLDEDLWENVDLIPLMWRAANLKRKKAPNRVEEDILWEITLR